MPNLVLVRSKTLSTRGTVPVSTRMPEEPSTRDWQARCRAKGDTVMPGGCRATTAKSEPAASLNDEAASRRAAPLGAALSAFQPSILRNLEMAVSTHVCYGGEDEPTQTRAEERTCMFKNLCYNKKDSKWSGIWQYHRHPDLAEPPTWTNVGNRTGAGPHDDPHVQTEFRAAVTHSSGFNEGFHVQVVDGLIPSNVAWISGLHYYRQPLGPWANAIGHMYAEYIYAIWHAMDVVGLVSRDVHVLMSDTPCKREVSGGPAGIKCPHFQTLMRGLSDQYRNESKVLRNFPPPGKRTTCYRSLLVGDGTLHGSSRRHPPESWGKFMHYWLAGIGINPRARPPKQRIIFINKGGTQAGGAHNGGANRMALNAKETLETLRATFDVPIDEWSWSGETLWDEVQMLQRYSICITVCGGTAFSCTHLPDGASNIYLSVWSSEALSGRPGNNNNMESVTWTWDSRHKHYAYPVFLNETMPDDTIPKHPQYNYGMRWKHNKGFKLHAGRLAVLLNAALMQTQWRMFGNDREAGGFRPLTRSKLVELNGNSSSGILPWRR